VVAEGDGTRQCFQAVPNLTPCFCCAIAVAAAENCVVVAEGEMGLDGVFRVSVLAFPSCESRAQLPATAQVSTALREPCCLSDTHACLLFCILMHLLPLHR
jgi:hypothetical protein